MKNTATHMEYLEKMGDAHDEVLADRARDEALDAVCGDGTAEILSVLPEPIFLDHFQTLLRTMEKTR